ncbi:site-2 protease family protein [Paenibacillus tarimensis]
MADQRNNRTRNPWLLLGAALVFLVSKGKSVLLLLTKFAGPLISMGITIGAYALLSPIWFAVGLVLLIFVHELGHVIAAKRKGLPVSAPLFIPFVGALITMKRHPKDAVTEAYIAFGGPLVGTVGALIVYAAGYWLDLPLLFALANVGFLLNLFNLLPIHPLDGGRIATAVSRWLWVAGLVGGAVLIIVLKSPILFIVWALFAWNLYQKYVKQRKKGKPLHVVGIYEVNVNELGLPWWYLSGEEHKRELPYTTYCKLTGEQIVQFRWETLNFHGEMELPMQGLIKRVQLQNSERYSEDGSERLRLHVRIEYEQYVNDRYYEVPPSVRWKYGAAYGGLALFLIAMMWNIHSMNLIVPIK